MKIKSCNLLLIKSCRFSCLVLFTVRSYLQFEAIAKLGNSKVVSWSTDSTLCDNQNNRKRSWTFIAGNHTTKNQSMGTFQRHIWFTRSHLESTASAWTRFANCRNQSMEYNGKRRSSVVFDNIHVLIVFITLLQEVKLIERQRRNQQSERNTSEVERTIQTKMKWKKWFNCSTVEPDWRKRPNKNLIFLLFTFSFCFVLRFIERLSTKIKLNAIIRRQSRNYQIRIV